MNENPKILTYPDKKLRRTSVPVSESDLLLNDGKEIKEWCKVLAETMLSRNGVGLAAPQVGDNRRIILIRDEGARQIDVLFNPIVLWKSSERHTSREGCLSVPFWVGVVRRHDKVKVSYINTKNEQKEEIFEGTKADIVQHEIDHLDGVLILDKLTPSNKILAQKHIAFAEKQSRV